jgi:tellurite resistance protein
MPNDAKAKRPKTTSIAARIKKLAKGLTAKQAADAFVRAQEDPTSVSPDERGKADEFEATVEAMFLMAAVDGELSEQELAHLAASVDAFAALDEKKSAKKVDPGPLLVVMNDKLESDGWNKRLAAVAERLRNAEARTFAFRLAAGVAFVDDHVAHAEAAALEALASALHITSEESQEILYDVRESLFDD